MFRVLTVLQQNLVYAIPVAMALGLVGGGWLYTAAPLKRFIVPVTFLMIYPMMTTLNVRAVFKGHDAKLQIVTQLVNFAIMPFVVWGLGRIFLGGDDPRHGLWAVGLFLIGVLPASGMTISWTGFAGGNKEAATKMLVFGLVIGALVAPVYTKVFMGATVAVDMLHMFRQILIFVFAPLGAGLVTQAVIRRRHGDEAWRTRFAPRFPPFSAIGVVLIAFLAMSLKARSIVDSPGSLLTILVPLVVFYALNYGLLTVLGRALFRYEDATAMVFGVVMRDLSIALAIAMTAFGPEGATIAMLIALAYVVQIQSAAWYVRLISRGRGA